jgi:hypothetical protein
VAVASLWAAVALASLWAVVAVASMSVVVVVASLSAAVVVELPLDQVVEKSMWVAVVAVSRREQ